MNIIITGGTGFIGKALAQKLIEKGHNITILTRKTPLNKLKANYKEVDYSNTKSLISAISNGDILVHLAAALFCRTKNEFFKANVLTTQNLVKAANETNIKKIVYISSLAAGGPSPDKTFRNEEMSDNPISYYGKSKLQAEKEIENFKKGSYIILRPPIVYGPKDSGFSKIAQWVKKGIMIVPGDENNLFSFIFLNDLIRCIIKSTEEENLLKEKFYVCENRAYKWKEFIEKMAEKMKVKKPIMVKVPKSIIYATGWFYEIFSFIGNFEPVFNRDKAREASGGNWICSPNKWEKRTGMTDWTELEKGLSLTFNN